MTSIGEAKREMKVICREKGITLHEFALFNSYNQKIQMLPKSFESKTTEISILPWCVRTFRFSHMVIMILDKEKKIAHYFDDSPEPTIKIKSFRFLDKIFEIKYNKIFGPKNSCVQNSVGILKMIDSKKYSKL